jgi:hypothetical protein
MVAQLSRFGHHSRLSVSDRFEITRVRKDQQSRRIGCSVHLCFSVKGPPGVHAVKTKVSSASGASPRTTHDQEVALDDGATGYVNVVLYFQDTSAESCILNIGLGNKLLGRFLVEPGAAQR